MQSPRQQRLSLTAARYACRRRSCAAQVLTLLLTLQVVFAFPIAAGLADPPRNRSLNGADTIDGFLAEKLNERGDLTLRKTSLPEALFAIGELWGLNLVVGEEVQGQVNCDFKAAPLGEILNTVLLSNGYSYRPFGRSLVIVRMADLGDINPLFETATIPIRAGDPQELVDGASVFNSPKGKTKALPSARSLLVVDYPDRVAMIRDFVSGLNDVSAETNDGPGAGDLQTMQLQPQFVPALMLKDALAAALSKEGKVIVIDGENRVVVVDFPYHLKLAQDILRQVDRPRPQVRITAYIYDVGLQDFESLGFNWSHALDGRLDANGDPQSSWAIDAITKVPFTANAVGGAMTFMNMSDKFDLNATITALNTCKDSRLLADPNVVVVDNENATVAIISEIPFQQLTQTGQGGNIGTTAFREAGVKLNVLPRIAADGTIQMVVEPEFSRLTGFTPQSNQPIIDRRTAKTTVRVVNGQTVVIGGLRQRTESGTFNGIPFLKDIPYLGVLFRSRETDVRESELIVFVKPEIISYAESMNCREAAAMGTTHRFLDNIPMAESAVKPLPPVEQSPQQLQQGEWEEVKPASKQPPSVEQTSPGLALSAQRGGTPASEAQRERELTANRPRSAWQQNTVSDSQTNAGNYAVPIDVRRLPPVMHGPPAQPAVPAVEYAPPHWQQRAPVNQPQPAWQDSQAAACQTPESVALSQSYAEPNYRPAAVTPRIQPVITEPASATQASDPAPVSTAPQSESEATPVYGPDAPSLPASEGENRLRIREHKLDSSDEVRSATWFNNVFRRY